TQDPSVRFHVNGQAPPQKGLATTGNRRRTAGRSQSFSRPKKSRARGRDHSRRKVRAMDRLCYSRTFIDEPSRFREFEPRSASCPALRSRKAERAMWTELCREETASRTQVAQLRQRAETLHSSQDAFAPLALWPSPSTGSRAHPQLCRRPCTFFAKGTLAR
ncbi:unnamed protein product, partial [Effrenium voratum]